MMCTLSIPKPLVEHVVNALHNHADMYSDRAMDEEFGSGVVYEELSGIADGLRALSDTLVKTDAP